MAEKNTRCSKYSGEVAQIFRSLDLQHEVYRDVRATYNNLVGNPPDKENTFDEIAWVTGSFGWFIKYKHDRYLSEWGSFGIKFMSSPIMYSKYRLYAYATKKIKARGPYITGCLKASPKVLVA